MGMYNMLFGESSEADTLLSLLGLTREDFYRYRDCYLEDDKIAVYTRGGGGNRECFCNDDWNEKYEIEHGNVIGNDGHFPDCVVHKQRALRLHPNYLCDEDDDYDCTYATFYFSVPEGTSIEGIESEPDRDEVWNNFLEVLKNDVKHIGVYA
jgi:hypothetical protein